MITNFRNRDISKSTQKILFFGIQLLCLISIPAIAGGGNVNSVNDAQEIATRELKKHIPNDFKNYSCKLERETKTEWFIGCEKVNEPPRPGFGCLVVVNKQDRSARIVSDM